MDRRYIHEWKQNLEGSPDELHSYIFPPTYRKPWIVEGITWHYLTAAFVSVVLQWGATGAAILIAYK